MQFKAHIEANASQLLMGVEITFGRMGLTWFLSKLKFASASLASHGNSKEHIQELERFPTQHFLSHISKSD